MALGRSNLWPLAALAVALLAVAACTGAQFQVSSEGWTALAVEQTIAEDGRVTASALYVGTKEGEVLALDPQALTRTVVGASSFTRPDIASSGQLWSFKPDSDPELGGVFGPPAVGEQRLYVGFSTADGESGVLYALNKDRDQRSLPNNLEEGEWEVSVEGKIVGGPALAPDLGLVIVGTDAGVLYGFEAETGFPAPWVRYPPPGDELGPVWSTPLVHGSTAYFGSLDHNVYAISLDTGGRLGGWPYTTGGGIIGHPLLEGDQLVVGSFDRNLYAIDVDSVGGRVLANAEKWFWSGAATDGSNIFASSINGQVFALDRDGNVLRTFEVEGPMVAQPTTLDSGGRTWVVMASENGALHLMSGAEQLTDAGLVEGSRIKAPLVSAGSDLFLSKEDGTVWALRLRGGQLDRLWSLDTTT